MNDWRDKLNSLTAEFWCGVGNLAELPAWADAANKEMGEVHPDVWDLYTLSSHEQAAKLLLKISSDVNGFDLKSWEAEPFIASAFKKALDLFLDQKQAPKALCALVNELDTVFNIVLSCSTRSNPSQFPKLAWLGNLWNCCDWCDESWTFEGSPALVQEARRVSDYLGNHQIASQ